LPAEIVGRGEDEMALGAERVLEGFERACLREVGGPGFEIRLSQEPGGEESVRVLGERGKTQQKQTKETKSHELGQMGTKLYHWSAYWRIEGAKASMIC